MHYKKILVALVFMSFLFNCKEAKITPLKTLIIPQPIEQIDSKWQFVINSSTGINYDDNEESIITIPSSEELLVPINISKVGKTRTITLKMPNYGIISERKQGAVHKAWTFIDEIIVN